MTATNKPAATFTTLPFSEEFISSQLNKAIMGKKERARWERFGDMHAMGKSIPQSWFGTMLLVKWMNAGLVRTVRHWEDSVEIAPNGTICEWNTSEIIATEKGLDLL